MPHALHDPIRHNAWATTQLLEFCGSEHRGQICTILGALGHEPPDLTPWAYAFASGRIG